MTGREEIGMGAELDVPAEVDTLAPSDTLAPPDASEVADDYFRPEVMALVSRIKARMSPKVLATTRACGGLIEALFTVEERAEEARLAAAEEARVAALEEEAHIAREYARRKEEAELAELRAMLEAEEAEALAEADESAHEDEKDVIELPPEAFDE